MGPPALRTESQPLDLQGGPFLVVWICILPVPSKVDIFRVTNFLGGSELKVPLEIGSMKVCLILIFFFRSPALRDFWRAVLFFVFVFFFTYLPWDLVNSKCSTHVLSCCYEKRPPGGSISPRSVRFVLFFFLFLYFRFYFLLQSG